MARQQMTISRIHTHLETIEQLKAENERLRAALTPTAQTKAVYSGEFTMTLKEVDDYGDDRSIRVAIPWTSIKEIMRAIEKYADEQTLPEGDNDPNGNRDLAQEIDGS